MVKDAHGPHHFHRRRRIHQKHEKYPHPDKLKRYMDHAIYFGALITPIMTLPQVAKIWVDKNASGISLISWVTYLFAAFFWLAYGIVHKEKPIILTNVLWIGLHSVIIAGTILYG